MERKRGRWMENLLQKGDQRMPNRDPQVRPPVWGRVISWLSCLGLIGLSIPAPLAAQRPDNYQLHVDWLLDRGPFRATIDVTPDNRHLVLENGLIRRTLALHPDPAGTGLATVGLDSLMTGASILRAVQPEALLRIDGQDLVIGGLTGQPNQAFLTPEWQAALTPAPAAWRLAGYEIGDIQPRLAWQRPRHHDPAATWPPAGRHLRLDFLPPQVEKSAPDADQATATAIGEESTAQPQLQPQLQVSVHYEIYDGLPLLSKWLTVRNAGESTSIIERFTAERLAVVEHSNPVEDRPGVPLPAPTVLHVETDQAFGGFNFEQANRHAVRWLPDPTFDTQVNYLKNMPCLLEVSPARGPAQRLEPGQTFESFRVFSLVYDSEDRERRGLALRQMYRVLAPWVTENPLMMHLRTADPAAVRQALQQCQDVGFEMLILSFGSGFNIENNDAAYVAQWQSVAAEAREMGIEIGGYSLLSSRQIGGGQDVVSPPGESPAHGHCPALTSPWGLAYFAGLRSFMQRTGFSLLEHDGSYPGDWDVTPRPPLQFGLEDSQWAQWRVIRDFYRDCRAQGIYLNVPDYYYLTGSNKCGMGYREVNWSLPRAQQLIHTRQNIFDGTWTKAPSMGWMFVPLTEYHGGGAAATIEPLAEHLDHYRLMLLANLSAGVQACYRGPRLYDTPATRDMVRDVVAWYKSHREILESDVIHLRRADARDWDGLLHVNPQLPERGLLSLFNPLPEPIHRELWVPLYYTGLSDRVAVSVDGGPVTVVPLDDRRRVKLAVTLPANGFQSIVFQAVE
jgi:hypothetical protein